MNSEGRVGLILRCIQLVALSMPLLQCGGGSGPVAPTSPAASPTPAATGPFAAVAGNWGGTVNQFGFGTYPVELALDANAALGGRAGEVQYPTLACGGYWTADGVTGTEYRATERITFGLAMCLDNVPIRFDYSQSPRQLAVRYIVGGQVAATATLTPR